jgi:hypothetical protein
MQEFLAAQIIYPPLMTDTVMKAGQGEQSDDCHAHGKQSFVPAAPQCLCGTAVAAATQHAQQAHAGSSCSAMGDTLSVASIARGAAEAALCAANVLPSTHSSCSSSTTGAAADCFSVLKGMDAASSRNVQKPDRLACIEGDTSFVVQLGRRRRVAHIGLLSA